MKFFRMVNSIFFRYDPVGIKRYGLPYECIEDEYYSEAAEIALKIDSWDNVENLANRIEDMLYGLFDFDDFQTTGYCTLIAREIWNGRRQQMKYPKDFFMEDIMVTREWKRPIVIEVD